MDKVGGAISLLHSTHKTSTFKKTLALDWGGSIIIGTETMEDSLQLTMWVYVRGGEDEVPRMLSKQNDGTN